MSQMDENKTEQNIDSYVEYDCDAIDAGDFPLFMCIGSVVGIMVYVFLSWIFH